MKALLAVTAILLSACSGLDRKIDEATYKHYPQYSEAKRAECRVAGDTIYFEKAQGGLDSHMRGLARLAAAEAFEKCMES